MNSTSATRRMSRVLLLVCAVAMLASPSLANVDAAARANRAAVGLQAEGFPYRSYLPLLTKPFPHLISDDFDNPTSGWPSWDTDSSAAGYAGGEYRILVKEPDAEAHAALDLRVNYFVVQADVRATASLDGTHGIYFADNYFHYFFEVSNGSYALYRRDGWTEKWSPIIDWTPSPWLRNGHQTNTLKVSHGSEHPINIGLYANGHLLVERSDFEVYAASVGLAATAASPNYEARFDNFSLHY